MSREAMQQALDALKSARVWKSIKSHSMFVPQYDAAIAALRAALEQPAAPAPVLTDAEIEKLAVRHEAFGFGAVDAKGFTTHGFDPEGLRNFAHNLLAAAIPPGHAVVKDEPVGWQHSATGKLYENEADVPLADGDEWAEPLYAARPGEKHD